MLRWIRREKWEAEKENQERPEERHHYLPLGNGVELNRLSLHVTGLGNRFLFTATREESGARERDGSNDKDRHRSRQSSPSLSSPGILLFLFDDQIVGDESALYDNCRQPSAYTIFDV